MHTRTTYVTFQHFSIFQRITHQRIGRSLSRLQFRNIINSIPQVQLFIRYLIGNQFGQTVRFRQRKFLHTGHVLDSKFGSHRTICDNMRHFFLTVLLRHPAKHFTTSVIIKVDIDIRQGDTVGIQETLKQQVIFNGVDFRNLQTICNSRSCCRSTSRPDGNTHVPACSDKVLHNQEVSRKTHRLHDMQFKNKPFLYFRTQRVSIKFLRTVKGQLFQIIRFELDTI